MTKDDVSVVLITWAMDETRMNLVRNTIKSLRKNTQMEYTFVVVDNGPDAQTDLIRSLKPDIHIINQINQGPGEARTQGASITNSKYIAHIDNDIELYPGWLEQSIATLERFPDKKLIAGPARSMLMKKRPQHKMGVLDGGYELWSLCPSYCWVMPRSAFNEVGRWSKTDPIEDREYCNRAVALGWAYIWFPGAFVLHMGKYKSFSKRKRLVNGVWI